MDLLNPTGKGFLQKNSIHEQNNIRRGEPSIAVDVSNLLWGRKRFFQKYPVYFKYNVSSRKLPIPIQIAKGNGGIS